MVLFITMPSKTAYQSLDLYNLSKKLVVACYELCANLPEEEKTNLSGYLKSAVIAMHITIAKGAFVRKQKKRKKMVRAAQLSLVIIDAVTEVLNETNLAKEEDTNEVSTLTSAFYQLLDQFVKSKA